MSKMNEKSIKIKKSLKFEKKIRNLILKERNRFSTPAGGAARESNNYYLKKNIIKKVYDPETDSYETKIYQDAKSQTAKRSYDNVEKDCLLYNHSFKDVEVSLSECSVCLNNFSCENPAMVTTCSHVFCRTCSYTMLLESSTGERLAGPEVSYGQIKCPICRTYLYADSFTKISFPSLRALVPDERTNSCSFLESLKNSRLEKCHSNLGDMIEMTKKLRDLEGVNPLPRLSYKISIQKSRREYCRSISYESLLKTLNETKQYLNESLIVLEKIMKSINSPHKNLTHFNISEFATRMLAKKTLNR